MASIFFTARGYSILASRAFCIRAVMHGDRIKAPSIICMATQWRNDFLRRCARELTGMWRSRSLRQWELFLGWDNLFNSSSLAVAGGPWCGVWQHVRALAHIPGPFTKVHFPSEEFFVFADCVKESSGLTSSPFYMRRSFRDSNAAPGLPVSSYRTGRATEGKLQGDVPILVPCFPWHIGC